MEIMEKIKIYFIVFQRYKDKVQKKNMKIDTGVNVLNDKEPIQRSDVSTIFSKNTNLSRLTLMKLFLNTINF